MKPCYSQDICIKYLHVESCDATVLFLFLLMPRCQMIRHPQNCCWSNQVAVAFIVLRKQLKLISKLTLMCTILANDIALPLRRDGISEHFEWNMNTKESHFLRRQWNTVLSNQTDGGGKMQWTSRKILLLIFWWSAQIKTCHFFSAYYILISSSDKCS